MEEPRRCLIIDGPRQADYEILLSALKNYQTNLIICHQQIIERPHRINETAPRLNDIGIIGIIYLKCYIVQW